jgi:hypothetical protein
MELLCFKFKGLDSLVLDLSSFSCMVYRRKQGSALKDSCEQEGSQRALVCVFWSPLSVLCSKRVLVRSCEYLETPGLFF